MPLLRVQQHHRQYEAMLATHEASERWHKHRTEYDFSTDTSPTAVTYSIVSEHEGVIVARLERLSAPIHDDFQQTLLLRQASVRGSIPCGHH